MNNNKYENDNETRKAYSSLKKYINELSDREKDLYFLKKMEVAVNNQSESKYFMESVKELFENFEQADREGKDFIISACIDTIMIGANSINRKYSNNLCERFGHKYGEWTTYEKTQKKPCYYYPHKEYDEVVEKGWEKMCTVCGYVHQQTEEPEEVRTAREEKERNEKIEQLQKELSKLEKEREEAHQKQKTL